MKTIFHLLDKLSFLLCVWFGTCFYMPLYLQRLFGVESHIPALYSWLLLLTGIATFACCFAWKNSKAIVQKPGYVGAAFIGSALGIMIGFSAILAIHGITPKLYQSWKDLPSWILVTMMAPFLLWQVRNSSLDAKV